MIFLMHIESICAVAVFNLELKGRGMSMRIGNRINMTIMNARNARIAKSKAFMAGAKRNTYSSGSTNKSGNSTLVDLLNKLNGNSSSTADKLVENQKKSYAYSMIERSTELLGKHMDKFLATGEKSLFGQEDKAAAKEQAVNEVESFVNDYNIMMGKLNSSSNAVDKAYAKKLQGYVSVYGSALKKAGITKNSNGLLELNTDVLKEADLKDLEAAFGKSDGFGGKISEQAKEIKEYAQKQIKDLERSSFIASSNYNRYGTNNSSYGNGSSYNVRG